MIYYVATLIRLMFGGSVWFGLSIEFGLIMDCDRRHQVDRGHDSCSAVRGLRVAWVEALDVGVDNERGVLDVVERVVDAEPRVDGPDVGIPVGGWVARVDRRFGSVRFGPIGSEFGSVRFVWGIEGKGETGLARCVAAAAGAARTSVRGFG